ncbi:MAG: PAS domain S-box protein [Deltaproteobacteria bacterium]|nr:PAS domain S-box protein [Deltaproteobacteria bacterium]
MPSFEDLSKERLINDLIKLRRRIDELERINEQKEKYEAELAETKAMFEGLFQFAPDAILVVDSQGIIIQVNQEAERLFGYAGEELIGLEHDIVVPDRFRKDHLEDRRQYMAAPHVRRMGTGLELCGRRKDGTEFPVDISLGPLHASAEIVTLAVVRDISERRRMEEDLEKHRLHLEEMVKKRTAELEIKGQSLQELNIALKVLLQQREEDKKIMEERFVTNIKNLVLPYVEQMKKKIPDAGQRSYLEIIEAHLNEITTPLLHHLQQFDFTPQEVRVATLVKQGMSTKEIAEILGIAGGSVDVHRRHIRKKLGLTNAKANLLLWLQKFEN